MTLAVMIIVAVLLVLGVGYLIFRLMRSSQTVLPQVTDEDAASRDHVVGVDEQGRDDHGLAGGAGGAARRRRVREPPAGRDPRPRPRAAGRADDES